MGRVRLRSRHRPAAMVLTAVTFAAVICSCGRSREPVPGFLRLVPSGLDEQPLQVGNAVRLGFVAVPDEEYRVGFTVPDPGARLGTACGTVHDGSAPAPEPGTFRVVLRDVHGHRHTLFERAVPAGVWEELVVDLSEYAGQDVELVLHVASETGRQDGIVHWATPVVATPDETRPNILLILIDSLRADHLGCYGYSRSTSPTLDSLASKGCLFSSAIAQSSWTLPSHASLFTSLYLKSHGTGRISDALSPQAVTLAEVLREAGYQTAAVISGGGCMLPRYGLGQGFDVYDASCYSGEPDAVANPCTNDRAVGWLRRWGWAPFFLFVHYWDVHHPYLPPAPYDTLYAPDYSGSLSASQTNRMILEDHQATPEELERLVALYDGEILYTDLHVRQLLDELETLGLSERTLVVLTSDHGDEFREHGGVGHGHTLFQELIRVPLIWTDPASPQAPRVANDVVQLIDIAPTILDRVGLPAPDHMRGASLLPLVRGRTGRRLPAFSEVWGGKGFGAIIRDSLKVICSLADSRVRAFDLTSDPTEHESRMPAELPGGEDLNAALSSFSSTTGPVTLRVEMAGCGPRGEGVLSLSGAPLEDVSGTGLEAEDSLSVNLKNGWLVFRPDCSGEDTDELVLQLRSASPRMDVTVKVRGQLASPDQIFVGANDHPEAVPFQIRGCDPRLRVSPSSLPILTPDRLGVRLWVVDSDRLPAATTELDPELRQNLEALGYLR